MRKLSALLAVIVAACVLFNVVACGSGNGNSPAASAADASSTSDASASADSSATSDNSGQFVPVAACATNDDCYPQLAAFAPCARWVCVNAECRPPQAVPFVKNGTPCDDNNACTTGDACDFAGNCLGSPVNCEDGNACTTDSCNAQIGCVHLPIATTCDDGSACTIGDKCANGECKGTPLACDDKNPCTDDSCDPAKGCINTPNTAPCDDANACTQGDTCAAGACKAGAKLDCDDGNMCTQDGCDPAKGCWNNAYPDGSACDDGNPFTELDACKKNANGTVSCGGHAFIVCTVDLDCAGLAGNECGQFTCKKDDAGVGVCGFTAKPASAFDDGNPCTADGCDITTGKAVHTPISGQCDDNNACTTGDQCVSGVCKGATASCNDNNACTTDSCDVATGCKHVAISCDDTDPYTKDGCSPQGGCWHETLKFSVTCTVPAAKQDPDAGTYCIPFVSMYNPATNKILQTLSAGPALASVLDAHKMCAFDPTFQIFVNTVVANALDQSVEAVGGQWVKMTDPLAGELKFALGELSIFNLPDWVLAVGSLPTCKLGQP